MKENIGRDVIIVGWCITSRTVITTHGELMELVSFQDTTAICETNIFPRAFRRYAHLIDLNEPFVLRGQVNDDHRCVTPNVTSPPKTSPVFGLIFDGRENALCDSHKRLLEIINFAVGPWQWS